MQNMEVIAPKMAELLQFLSKVIIIIILLVNNLVTAVQNYFYL